MLNEWLTRETIQVIESVDDWQAALKSACQPLIDSGKVETSYLEAIYTSHAELGPYYVVGPKIAMPHARPEDGVNELSLGLTVIKQGVSFGSEGNDPVYLLFTLAAIDSDSHVGMISQLAELFMNESDIELLCQCTTADEILAVTKKY